MKLTKEILTEMVKEVIQEQLMPMDVERLSNKILKLATYRKEATKYQSNEDITDVRETEHEMANLAVKLAQKIKKMI